jgi:hypothetical protein
MKVRSAFAILLGALILGATSAPPAEAGDLTAFAAFGRPGENWSTGYGAALSWGILPFLSIEGEAARVPGALDDSRMTSFTGSAFVSPPTGNVTVYAGLGAGYYRQSIAALGNSGFLTALILGAKAKIGGVLVIRGEYRKLKLHDDPLMDMDSRFSVGAGISF